MKSRRRIVFITTGLLTGGAEMMLWHLLTRLPRGEFEPIVVSLRAEGPMRSRFEQAGITVCSPEMNPAVPNPLAWWRLLRLVRALQPDILQGWMYHANVAASWCSRFLKDTRLFFSIHNSIYRLEDEKFITGLVIKRGATLSPRTERVIYCAHSTAAQHEALGYSPQRTLVIPNGFDTDIFKPDPKARQLLRGELQASSNTLLMGLIARFDPHKDHETFFAAARLIADALPEARFVLAGKGVDPSNSILAHLTARHSLQEHVCLLGERSDIPTIMAGLDVLISSSSSEALPSVVGEALACEVPCVVTDVGDSKALASSGGQVVPPRDPKALAQAAIEIGRRPPQERQALGASGRAHIVRNFSISTMVRAYSDLYSSGNQSNKAV